MNDDTIHLTGRRVNTPRQYVSPLRRERARATRQQVIDAARELFLRNGYVSTSITGIAREAGVSAQSLYVIFGTKREILSAVMDVAIGGDAQPVGVLERSGPEQMRQEADQRVQLQMMAHGICDILDRAGPLFDVMRVAAASDGDIADAYQHLQDERRRNMSRIIGWIAAHGPLKAGLTETDAADILWALTSAEIHRMLRIERKWTSERFETWLADSLKSALLP